MSVTKISDPLAGEHVVLVYPPIAPTVESAGWRRRLRPYTGRSLSDTALRAEQDYRAGQIVTLAQALSPGVVRGLEVSIEWPATGSEVFLHVGPGIGLCSNGEDAIVPRALRVALHDLLPSEGTASLRAAVLVLEPVESLSLSRFDPDDPCEIDESAIAFSDEQRVDGALLRLLPWQDSWSSGPLDDSTASRSALANRIFAAERHHSPGQIHPWEATGVPLALLGFESGALVYVDRAAVAREGGCSRSRTPLLAAGLRAGTPRLWQAQVHQLAAHLQDLVHDEVPVSQWFSHLRKLPPAGLLPISALDLGLLQNRFFPSNYSLRMAPLPLEQLDWLFERCASLAPLEVDRHEQVLIIVPVPQAVYEPALLVVEAVPSIFSSAVTDLRAVREEVRARREFVRTSHRALVESVSAPLITVSGGTPQPSTLPSVTPTYDDSGALETEPAVTANQAGEDAFGVTNDPTPNPTSAVRRAQPWLELRTRVQAKTFLSADEKASFGLSGLSAFIESLKAKIDRADDAIDFSFLKVHTDIYRARQLMLGTAVASRLLTSPALASLVKTETAVAQREDVSRFYLALKGKAPMSGIEGSTSSLIVGLAPATPAEAPRPLEDTAFSGPSAAELATTNVERMVAGIAMTSTGLISREVQVMAELASGTAGALRGLERQNVEREFIERTREKIQDSEPIVGGAAYDFRTTSIAKRLDAPPASEARSYTAANRYEAVTALDAVATAGLNLDGVPVHGVATGSFDTDGLPVRQTQAFETLRAARFGALLNDPPPRNPLDDGVHVLESVRLLEHNIATLRGVEARVANYRQLLSDCQNVLAQLRSDLTRADARLRVLDDQVDDARHRVATALALLADEELRVQRVNQRRRAVLAQHVRTLAYVRPRSMEAVVEAPAVTLDPGLLPPAVPACFAVHDDPPPELEAMLQLIREAPVSFFRYLPKTIEKLDRVELLHGTIAMAQLRARALVGAPKSGPGGLLTFASKITSSKISLHITRTIDAQHARIAERRSLVSRLDLARFVGLGWRESQEQALDVLTIGDLIESNHGRRVVSQQAQAELDRIGRIGACLYAQVGEVLPAIRLEWAERLGQHDSGVPLGNLAALPRFGEIPFADRKDLQELTDWLYDRIDKSQPEALGMMHDFVRVCILLASHAPVDEIIAGHVAADSRASPGVSVPVAIDPLRVKLGMRALFYRGQELLAHGVVDDLTGTQGRARVLETAAGVAVSLAKDTKVRFVSAENTFLPASFARSR